MARGKKMPPEQKAAIGLRIRDIRSQRGVTIVQLAQNVGVSRSHISNLEHGKASVRLEVMIAISEALNVSLDYIVLGERMGGVFAGLVLRSDDELSAIYPMHS